MCQMLIKEIEIWRRLQHPHVALFLRACIESSPPFLVSELYQYGNAVEYLLRFPRVNRLKLVRIFGMRIHLTSFYSSVMRYRSGCTFYIATRLFMVILSL